MFFLNLKKNVKYVFSNTALNTIALVLVLLAHSTLSVHKLLTYLLAYLQWPRRSGQDLRSCTKSSPNVSHL